jgi:hypothetical protein
VVGSSQLPEEPPPSHPNIKKRLRVEISKRYICGIFIFFMPDPFSQP